MLPGVGVEVDGGVGLFNGRATAVWVAAILAAFVSVSAARVGVFVCVGWGVPCELTGVRVGVRVITGVCTGVNVAVRVLAGVKVTICVLVGIGVGVNVAVS